jgi:excinuclease ABC subunit C
VDSSENIKNSVKSLPDSPGVYRFYDRADTIIYVGKAKNLKKRVASYFNKNQQNHKTNILVRKIHRIEHIVVETETDALLLENSLIKKYKPRYNVLLKDDKTYPWICIKNEPFPRVFQTRNYIKDNSIYFGPYTSISLVRSLLQMFRQLFFLRNCSLNLSEENIKKNKFKVCLEYHLGNCKAPCVGFQNEDEYNEQISQIQNILKGNFTESIRFLNANLHSFSEKLDFENAQKIKDKIDLLSDYQSKSTIVSQSIGNIDVFSILDDEQFAYINFLKIVNGAVIQVQTYEIKKKLDETVHELLPAAIVDIYQNRLFGTENVNEILVPFKMDYILPVKKVTVPLKGDKKKLLDLSERNVKYYRLEKNKQRTLIDPNRHVNRILLNMKNELRLSELPVHIECFDNSNIQGSSPVASCVVFKNGKPSKKDYRKFIIKTVEGPNDFASMEEIIYRRYKRLIEEKQNMPQLIIIDGGKGQLSSAVKILEQLNLYGKISVIGIAKKLEEIFFPNDNIPIYLNKNSETLKIIQHARDEAHRFAITFHRSRRSKKFVKTELSDILGIGNESAEILLSKFKSVKKISELSLEDLEKIIGKAKAEIIHTYFHNI